MISEGRDPIAEKRLSAIPLVTTPTFGQLSDDYIMRRSREVRSERSVARLKRCLEKYAAPLRPLKPNEIATKDVLSILMPIWQEKPETAKNTRGYVEAVLDAAKALGHLGGDNPARWKGNLDHLLSKRTALTRGHHAAMPYERVGEFCNRLRANKARSAVALEFLILTAARTSEVRLAVWREIDFERAIWTIPADRMKGDREHRVPLSSRAVEILACITADHAAPEKFVFSGQKPGAPLSNMSFEMLLRRLGASEVTTHGFRSSFRDWAGERTGHAREVAEAALAHVIGDHSEQAYRRQDAIEKRRILMEDWCGFLRGAFGSEGTYRDANERSDLL